MAKEAKGAPAAGLAAWGEAVAALAALGEAVAALAASEACSEAADPEATAVIPELVNAGGP